MEAAKRGPFFPDEMSKYNNEEFFLICIFVTFSFLLKSRSFFSLQIKGKQIPLLVSFYF